MNVTHPPTAPPPCPAPTLTYEAAYAHVEQRILLGRRTTRRTVTRCLPCARDADRADCYDPSALASCVGV